MVHRQPAYNDNDNHCQQGISLSMLIEDWSLDRIRPYPNNPRVLRNAAEKVADSIREFGWRQPIVVDEDGVVIIGHARLAAANLLKLPTAPVHVARGLPDEKVRALRIADNKTSEFAAWDDQKLADELQAIMASAGTIALTGFSQAEFDAIAMQAEAELAAVLNTPAAGHAGAASVPAAEPASAEAPATGEFGPAGDDEGFDHSDTSPGGSEAPAADLVPFNALLRLEDRAVVFDAITRAKELHGLATSGEALLVIARSYLA